MLAFVLGLSFLLLLVAFRSIVIPATAIALNLLSTGAAYGIMTLVFQDGWFARTIGITPGPVIESFVPLFVFTIVYGLSMDYHFFILTRIKEGRDRGLDSRTAVAERDRGHRGHDHERRGDHGGGVRGLRDHEVRDDPAARARARGRGVRRRDDHPEHPAAGGHAPARRLELVPAVVPRVAAAGHDRGRAGRAIASGPGWTGGAGAPARSRTPPTSRRPRASRPDGSSPPTSAQPPRCAAGRPRSRVRTGLRPRPPRSPR